MKRLVWLLAVTVLLGGCARENHMDSRLFAMIGTKIAGIQSQASQISQTAGVLEAACAALSTCPEPELQSRLKDFRDCIAAVRAYVPDSDWAATTMSTLDLQRKVLTEIYSVRIAVPESRTDLLLMLDNCEDSMKGWVNCRFIGFSDIAQTAARIENMSSGVKIADDDLQTDFDVLQHELDMAAAQMCQSYSTAVSTIIGEHDGVIGTKQADDILTAWSTLKQKTDDINDCLDGMSGRMSEVGGRLTDLIGSISSITVIPQYSDGSVGIAGTSRINFEIYPADAARRLAEADASLLSMRAVYTETKSDVEMVDIPVLSHVYADGIYSVFVKADCMTDAFYMGEASASARLLVSDGTASQASAYFPLTYESEGNSIFQFALSDGKQTVEAVEICGDRINVCLPKGTDLTKLVATFRTDGFDVTINGVPQRSGKNLNDFSGTVIYTVSPKNGTPRNYAVNAYCFDLPQVFIEMPGQVQIMSKEEWVAQGGAFLRMPDGTIDGLGGTSVSVKGRGNSSWTFPKKSYTLKFDKKTAVLGMPKDKRWNLLANWVDRTRIRNAVALELARKTKSLAWTPQGTFVELFLNGELLGNYYLTESVKVGKDRLDITKLKPDVISGDELTGGYLLEFDTYYDEPYRFRTSVCNFPVNLKSPDEDVPDEQLAYISGYVNRVEEMLYREDPATSDYKSLIDIDTYIDWFLVNEMCGNLEPFHPKSSFMYKDRGGKLCAGPCWDFDWGTFTKATGWSDVTSLWYPKLLSDPAFVARLKEKWAESMDDFLDVLDFIDDLSGLVGSSVERDVQDWPLDGSTVNRDEGVTLGTATTRIKTNLRKKIEWMDKSIADL